MLQQRSGSKQSGERKDICKTALHVERSRLSISNKFLPGGGAAVGDPATSPPVGVPHRERPADLTSQSRVCSQSSPHTVTTVTSYGPPIILTVALIRYYHFKAWRWLWLLLPVRDHPVNPSWRHR